MRLRCFLALPLDEELLDACTSARSAFLAESPAWEAEKWVRREDLHVTLQFIGNVEERFIPDVVDALGRVLPSEREITLSHPRLSAIPQPRRATMLWLSLTDTTGACATLAAEIASATDSILRPQSANRVEDERFRPHVTLCRARRSRRVPPDAISAGQNTLDQLFETMSYPRVTLYASQLTTAGPHYHELVTWPR